MGFGPIEPLEKQRENIWRCKQKKSIREDENHLAALYSGPQRLLRSNHFGTIPGRNWPGTGSTSPRQERSYSHTSDAARPIESELMYA